MPALEGETSVIYQIVSFGLYLAVLIGTTYIALEPFARRWWSELLISWNRLLAGDFRDPMIGRDILVGGVFGVGGALLQSFQRFLQESVFGKGEQISNQFFLEPLSSWTGTVSRLLEGLAFPVLFGLGYLFLLLVLFIIFRNKKTSIILFGLLIWLSSAVFAFQSQTMDRRNFLTYRRFDHNLRHRPFRTSGNNHHHFLFSFVQCLFNYF